LHTADPIRQIDLFFLTDHSLSLESITLTRVNMQGNRKVIRW